MSFMDHFNDIDISDIVNEDYSGIPCKFGMYGYGNDNIVNFFASERIDENSNIFYLELNNPLFLKFEEYNLSDSYFATKCVGYAVENFYDSVVIESAKCNYIITVNMDNSEYLTEAPKNKPLSGKRIPMAKKKEIAQRNALRKNPPPPKPTANKPKSGVIKRPKKAPQEGIKIDVLLSNTGKLSPQRVERAMKEINKKPPTLSGVKEVQGKKYFRAEYNFKSKKSQFRQMGYGDISQDRQYCKEMFCSCSDFFYRLYAPYVAAGLSTWNLPPKYKSKQSQTVNKAPHNQHWTVQSNPQGKLFLCKHLWAFLGYYITGKTGGVELSDEEIESVINKYFVDVDDDGDEEIIDTPFSKAMGKLYANRDKDKDIGYEEPEEIKEPEEPEEIDTEISGEEELIPDNNKKGNKNGK